MRLLKSDDHRRMAWKNGRGETVEIAVFPPEAGLGDFGWRVSMAAVVEDGAFSLFPGVDRTLAVLTGEGVDLDVADVGARRVTADGEPLAFAADAPTRARLVGGPITDLNVMTRRGVFSHRLSRLDAPASASGACEWRILLASAALEARVAGAVVALGPLDALWLDRGEMVEIVSGGAFHLVEIDRP